MMFDWYKILNLNDEILKNGNLALYLDEFFSDFDFEGYDKDGRILVSRNNKKYYVNFNGNKLYLRARCNTYHFDEIITNELEFLRYYDSLEVVYIHNYKFVDKDENIKKIFNVKSNYVSDDGIESGFAYLNRIDIKDNNDKYIYPSVICGTNIERINGITYLDNFNIKQRYCKSNTDVINFINDSPIMDICMDKSSEYYISLLNQIPEKEVYVPKRKIGFY